MHEAKVRQELLAVDGRKPINRLQLDDDLVFDHQIRDQTVNLAAADQLLRR